MLICSSLPFFLRKKSLCGSPFKLSCGLELCILTPSIDLLEPWMNKDKWIGIFSLDLVTRLHRRFTPKSTLNVLQVQPVRSFNNYYFPLQLHGAFGLYQDLISFLSCLLSCLHGKDEEIECWASQVFYFNNNFY